MGLNPAGCAITSRARRASGRAIPCRLQFPTAPRRKEKDEEAEQNQLKAISHGMAFTAFFRLVRHA